MKDIPFKSPIKKNHASLSAPSQPDLTNNFISQSQISGESQVVSEITASQLPVTVPSPLYSTTRRHHSTPVQYPPPLHPTTHTYIITGEY
jgi:hypothetical protein